jgi:hypothetical protein
MPTGYNFTTYQEATVTQIPSLASDPNFLTMLPDAIDYAELTIYRDLDFLNLHGAISIGNTTGGVNTYAIPTAVIAFEQLFLGSALTPIPPMSQAALRGIYSTATQGPPRHFAIVGSSSGATWVPSQQILLGPTPDQAYALTGYVTERQAPLSASNPTTFLSTVLPDLFWAASMIFWSGYAKAFGAMADDPKMAISWSAEYQRILHGAAVEEAKKKFADQGWRRMPTPPQPTPAGRM